MERLIGSYIEHFNGLRDSEEYIEYFIDFAVEYLRKDPVQVKAVLEHAYNICLEQNYIIGQSECLIYLAWCYNDVGTYKQAEVYCFKAKKLLEKVNDYERLIKVYNILLVVHREQGKLENALYYGVEGMKLIPKIKVEERIIAIQLNTCSVYVDLEEWTKLEALLEQISKFNYSIEEHQIVYMDFMFARVYFATGRGIESYQKVQQALKRAIEKELYFCLAENYQLLGDIYISWSKYTEGERYLRKALKYAKNFNQDSKAAYILLSYGESFEKQKKHEYAIKIFKKGYQDIQKWNSMHLLVRYHEALSRNYKSIECYKESLEHLEKFNLHKQEIFNMNNQTQCERLNELQNANKENTYEALFKRIEDLLNISKKVTVHLNVQKVCDAIYEEIKNIIQLDVFGIALYNEQSETIQYNRLREQKDIVDYGEASIYCEQSIGAYCIRNKQDIYIQDLTREYTRYVENYEFRCNNKTEENIPKSIIYCYLSVEDKPVGIMTIQNKEAYAYTMIDFTMLKILASYVAIAISNANLFETVHYLAHYDDLTKLLNRKSIIEEGKKALEASKGQLTSVGIIMMDLDYFKQINDCYGHLTGDRVLKETGKIMKDIIGELGKIGRYGGEEFMIVLPQHTQSQTIKMAEYLRQAIQNSSIKESDHKEIALTASLGVYCSSGEETIYEALKIADKMLYRAKDNGRNCVLGM